MPDQEQHDGIASYQIGKHQDVPKLLASHIRHRGARQQSKRWVHSSSRHHPSPLQPYAISWWACGGGWLGHWLEHADWYHVTGL